MRTRAKKKYVASDRARRENVPRHILFYFIGNCVAFPIKKALRVNRTAAERNLSLRDPPQAQNPALQDSIFTEQEKWGDAKCEVSRNSVCHIGLILISTYIIIEIYAQKTGVLRTHRKSCAGRERKSHGEHMEQSD